MIHVANYFSHFQYIDFLCAMKSSILYTSSNNFKKMLKDESFALFHLYVYIFGH